ncbi:HigA family addiction module antidote protein [Petrimonas sulfuriphila]|uniref:HigA family addiction module antitoxin n=1 Tax=Petrimonas sulfuriphila TaxID=285070 RepID=UPI003248A1D5
METKNEFIPKTAILPGSVLKLELDERGISQKNFANEIGMKTSNLNEYIRGKRSFTSDFSLKLEEALQIPANTWMNLQQNYELAIARKRRLDIDEQAALNEIEEYDKIISTKDLLKRLNITAFSYRSKLDQLTSKLNLPPAAELQVCTSHLRCFKKSAKLKTDPRMVLSWTILAKSAIKDVQVGGEFNISDKELIVRELNSVLHKNEDTINKVRDILSNRGIRFSIVDKLDSTPIDGYSFYHEGTPCIVITKRRDKIDNFAFVLLHEIGHIFLHLSKNQSKEFITLEEKERVDKLEKEADKFASDGLISEKIWKNAPAVKLDQYQIQKVFTEWANSNNLNKWIVLGRIGHELNFWRFREDGTRSIN